MVEEVAEVESVGELNLKGFSRPVPAGNVRGVRPKPQPAELPA